LIFFDKTIMITPETINNLRIKLEERASADKLILEQLRAEVRPLKDRIRQINPRTATAISLVAADGGNNKIEFDPYLFQLVRVVDSYGKELLIDVASPTVNIEELSKQHLDKDGTANSALGLMMKDLGVETLWDLSPMIPDPNQQNPSPSWVLVYRDLAEWAVLYQILKGDFGTDTLIVRDGILRSKIFAGELFIKLKEKITDVIERIYRSTRRNVYLVGFAKKSKVLSRYRLAFALENILTQTFSCYVEIPREIEAKAYVWPEYAKGEEGVGEAPKFVAGKMFMVKFGKHSNDPIWPVDIFIPQVDKAFQIMGYLLADSQNGFPVPLYPRCLQKAHEQAALVGFDMEVMEDIITEAVRRSFNSQEQGIVDRVRFQSDVSRLRYE
jgi:hypothetical protein